MHRLIDISLLTLVQATAAAVLRGVADLYLLNEYTHPVTIAIGLSHTA